jgi:hypothetical protein
MVWVDIQAPARQPSVAHCLPDGGALAGCGLSLEFDAKKVENKFLGQGLP